MASAIPLRGRAWVFGDNLDVDWDICDLHVLQALSVAGRLPSEEELRRMCLVRVAPEFPRKVQKGDFVVAGQGTGYSAACLDGMLEDPHRYALATLALKSTGVTAVLCESANVTFLMNSFNAGLPVVECRGITTMVRQGDEVEVDLARGVVRDLTTGEALRFTPLPPFLLELVEAGGLYTRLGHPSLGVP